MRRGRRRWSLAGLVLVLLVAALAALLPDYLVPLTPSRPVKRNARAVERAAPERELHIPAATLPAAPASAGQIACQPSHPGAYVTCHYAAGHGPTMTFYLYVPVDYDPRGRYPLVLLLHGGGERAVRGESAGHNRALLLDQPYVEVWGPGYHGPHSVDVQARWPSFVVVPQDLAPLRWVDVLGRHGSYTLADRPTTSLAMAKGIVDGLQRIYTGIDPARRYITGVSMGGYGTWDIIERWPRYFAAAAPVCGAGDPSQAARLKDLPIWAFHGAVDRTVPVSGSRDMIRAIEAAGGHPRYTEFAAEGHDIWPLVYSVSDRPSPVPDFFPWLFAQHAHGTAVR